jgi:hypothetical protein
MEEPKRGKYKKIYTFKVSLSDWSGNTKGSPYRVIAIPERFTLYELAEEITEAFNFDFDHPFGFYDNIDWIDSEGYELFADMGEESESKGVKKTRAKDVFDEIGKKMLFLFDYGDEWHFIVKLVGVESPSPGIKYPRVLESVGKAPMQYPEEENER